MTRIILIMFIHLIGDMFFQGNKLSTKKASKLSALLKHTSIYTLVLIICSPLMLNLDFKQTLIFALLNGALHLIVDYYTSKLKNKYWETDENKYILTVGLDHFIHLTLLIVSYYTLFPISSQITSTFG